jgi:hypothetical protein
VTKVTATRIETLDFGLDFLEKGNLPEKKILVGKKITLQKSFLS